MTEVPIDFHDLGHAYRLKHCVFCSFSTRIKRES
jgi:hypothetical protein